MKRIIYNAHIITMNAAMDIIPEGSILIEDGRISSITPGRLEMEGAEMTDARGMFVMPGFINTHTHVPMTMLKGYADDLPLFEWLTKHIFPAEARWVTPENVRTASRMAFIEMIKSGTTCFNDMYFFEEVVSEEAAKAGLRAVVGAALSDSNTPGSDSVPDGIAHCEEIIKMWEGSDLIHPTVCLHAPYTCSRTTLIAGKELSDKYGTMLHIHVAETRKEVSDITAQTGLPPVEYLHRIGVLDRNTVAAHCVWLNPKEVELMAKTGASIAHCPKSNLKLASGIADVDHYIQNGITVGLGTDGSASNNTLDMVEEMRFAALLPKVLHYDPKAMDARSALRMATSNGAKALGLGEICGSLECGKSADLILVHADSSNMQPVYDEYSSLVYAMNSKNIRCSMVKGEWLMKDRQLCTLDKEACMEDMDRLVADIKKG